MWRFESIHSFGAVGNLYQKMHFAGSNLSTDPKCPKCIYKISKNFRVEKSGEISRNLRFSRFFVPASKSDTHHGWDSWTRTNEMQESKSCALTNLAISQYLPCYYNIDIIFLSIQKCKKENSFVWQNSPLLRKRGGCCYFMMRSKISVVSLAIYVAPCASSSLRSPKP